MTITEAIETLRANYPDACFEQLREAVDMAINALTKEAWKEEHPVSPLLQKLATNLQHSKQDDLIASAQPVDKDIYVPINDTISRQAAIDALAKFVPYAICDESTESYTNGLTDAYNLICQLPSAQPEQSEIIRCKDCKRWNTVINRKKAKYGLCQIQTQLRAFKRDDWCSRAERKTDE